MRRYWSLLLWLAFASTGFSQTITRHNLASILGFENGSPGQFPTGWLGGPADTIFTDNRVAFYGANSARIERYPSSSLEFSTLTAIIPLDFAGKTIEWRGFIKTQNVDGFVALWLREDGDAGSLKFATLQRLNLHGTTDWTRYSVSVPVVPEGKQLYFGFLPKGSGTGWVDNLELLVDGKPAESAPNRESTILNTDHEFDKGSRIDVKTISDIQVRNLATLAKVWGFLKYHHPAVTGGLHHWDYELFRILPLVLNASDRATANNAISSWIAGFGKVDDCIDCASLNQIDLHLSPDLDWILDESFLDIDLSQMLQAIYRNRRIASEQFYVSLAPNIGNPVFEHELDYWSLQLPDSGYQLLALFRYWNMVRYFYPNRDIMADDPIGSPNYWNEVLEETIPGIAMAADSQTYQQELMKFIAKIHDTHANLWSSITVRPPIGTCQLPIDVRFVEGYPLIIRYNSITAGPASGLLPGDLIEELDGVPINSLLDQWKPYYADSNEAARLRDIGQFMTRGSCGTAVVKVRRGANRLNVLTSRVPSGSLDLRGNNTHDLPGDTFQMISNQIAYLKLSSVKSADSASYIQAAAGTKGLIIDIRNYPSEFVVFSLGQLLVSRPTNFVRFTNGDITNPGAFHWRVPLSLTPQYPHYNGKVVILVDEVTQSQAEYTALALRTAPNAIIIGSSTAGADGDVSRIPLPGGFFSYISGIGVFSPDKLPTQRIGIVPDIEAKPTIEGMRAGRDELIERAIQILTAKSDLALSLASGGAGIASTVESGSAVQTGYAAADVNSGNAPYGVAVFSSKQNGVTVSEAGVPASPPTTWARIYVDYRAGVYAVPARSDAGTVNINTGIALVNCGTEKAYVTYVLHDSNASALTSGHGIIEARSHITGFIDQLKDKAAPDFNFPSNFRTGSLEILSDQPLSVLALRGTMNQRNEFLMTTTPIADLTKALSNDSVYFPQFADGDGSTTSLILMNTSDQTETGILQIRDDNGNPLIVNESGGTANATFNYSIPARGVFRFQSDGSSEELKKGWIILTPTNGTMTPVSSGVFGYNPEDVLVSESGIPSVVATTLARIYVDLSGNHNTGIAVANISDSSTSIALKAYQKDGVTPIGSSEEPILLPAKGHAAAFADQFISGLPQGFTGVLDISSLIPFAALTVRSLDNERGEFLMTTFPVADSNQTAPSPIIFPQIADGGGNKTEFILISPGGQANITLNLYDNAGTALELIK